MNRAFTLAKYRAKKNGCVFELDLAFMSELYERQGRKCAYSGRVLQRITGHPDVLSIDRVDNSCGYTKANVVLVSAQVNSAKSALSMTEFVRLAREVTEHIGVTHGMP